MLTPRPDDRPAVHGEGPDHLAEGLHHSRGEQAGEGQEVSYHFLWKPVWNVLGNGTHFRFALLLQSYTFRSQSEEISSITILWCKMVKGWGKLNGILSCSHTVYCEELMNIEVQSAVDSATASPLLITGSLRRQSLGQRRGYGLGLNLL